MRGFKQHKKMYKSGKFWVVAGLTVVSLITANDTSKVFDLFSDRLGSVFAAQTNSSATIDTVTDADTATGGSRTVSWNGSSAWNYSDVTGLGSYNGSTWTGDRAYGSTLYKDPAGAYYTKLVANGASTAGYTYLTRQFDATKTFTVTGYLHPNVRDADQFMPRDYSDWTGLLLTPTDPNKIATAYDFSSKGGGGLGIEGMKNAYAFGIDFHKNTDKNDPAEGPFGALRTTNSSGTLTATQGKQSGVAGTATYTDGYNLSNWSSTIKYTLTWNPTGGPNGGPSIVATMTTNKTQNSESSSWTVDTAKAKVTLAPATALTVGLNAINGQNKNDQYASFDSMSGTLSTGTTTVKYVDANGNTIKDPTTFVAAVGDIIGISGLSSGAKAGTDDMAFAAPTIRGYTASSANDVTVSQTAGNNVITIKYKGTVQQEAIVNTNKPELWNGSSAITSYWNIDQTKPLGGSSLASSIVDASLVRSGYNYTVTDPNGSSYATMSAAYAAATNAWDSTANTAGVASDASPQNWTVNYTAQSQTAYLYTQNYTYDGSSYVTSGTASYMQGIYGPTDGSISFNTTDSALAKSGYTYTVQGPGGVTEYSTLASAQAIERFDNTNNSGSSDGSYQTFTVNYRPVTQTTSLVVDGLSPIKAGSTVASSVGTTSAALTIPYTDASLSTAGYTYVVKGPNGSTYSTLSSAVAANSIYDATNNSAATDSSAQVFTVSYIGQTQSAVIKYDPNGPLSAGTTFASTSGATNTSISFATNDGGLVRAGYTYTVTYAGSDKPDSVAYTTLSSALAAHPRYDSTAYAGTTDTSSQAFIVTYKTNQYANLITSAVDTSGNSLLNYSAISEIANGPASSTISFSNKDSQLAKSGYTYVVHVYDQMGSAASLLGTYTTLASAVAAQKYDNTQNATNARTDAYQQQFKVVYSPRTATVTYNFVDQSGKTISPATSATGPVGSNIPDGSKLIQGYTLISSSGDTDGKFDDDLVSTITYTYKAQYQAANVVVDSSSPIKMNSAVDSAAGVTSGSISFAKTDSQLAVSGYTYVVYAPNGSSYATLSAATAANNLYDNTENGSGSSDSSAQNFRVSYKANYQSAYIRVQQNSPINTGSMIESVTGVTDGSMTFSTTDSNLAVSGYTYQVGYGPDATHTTYYSTLAEAMSAAGGKFDSTNNTASTDAEAQRFVVNYIPMSQAAVINVSADSPISANSQAVMSANGKTGSTINFLPNGSFTTADSQLAVSGYTYTLTYGSDSTSYATLSAAVSAHNKYNANNTTSGISDANPDMFTITYSANTQSAVIAVTSTSPISAGSLADSASGSTSGTISFAKDDQALGQLGYTYTVTGPDGTVYSNLASALANNGLYDNTNNLGPSDVAVQSFMVSYSAAYQEARVILDSTGPYSSQSVADSASGVTSGSLGFSISDGDLALSGYHYTVWGRYGSRQYATLSAAVGAESSFDNTDNGSAVTDRRIQGFYVVYTADSQSAVVQVATDSPINGGQTLDSAAGVTSGSISFAANTENSLYSPGYHYTVTGPDGSEYATLSAASVANNVYDSTNNIGNSDADIQTFTVSYVAQYQSAALIAGSASNLPSNVTAGLTFASSAGVTSGRVSFATSDSDLARSGYRYTISTPDGTTFTTLSSALAGSTGLYDNTANAGASDASAQQYTVNYLPEIQTARVIISETTGDEHAGEVLSESTGNTNEKISFTLSDGSDLNDTNLQKLEMTKGYTYTVIVEHPNGSTSGPYATLQAAYDDNPVYDDDKKGITTFIIVPQASYQEAVVNIGSAGTQSDYATSASGVTSGAINFGDLESSLAVSGYGYTVTVIDDDGNRIEYATLSAAVAAVGNYDNTVNGSNQSDSSAQAFDVNYTADYQSANVTFSGAPMSSVAFVGETSATLESTKFTADSGYYFDAQQPSYSGATTSVSSDGKELWVSFTYDDTNNSAASDSDPQNFEFTLQPATQQGNIMYSYSNAVSVPSDAPADESLSGKTGQPQSGTIKAPSGYYIAAINGDQYNVTYNDAATEAEYTLLWDDTPNGNAATDSKPQNLVVIFAPGNQRATVSQTMPGGTTTTVNTQNGRTDKDYSYEYTAPSGYYVADDGITTDGKGLISGVILSDGTTVTFTGKFDNNYTNYADENGVTDPEPQNTTIKLTASTQIAQFQIKVPDGATSVSQSTSTVRGDTGKTIEAPDGYTDEELNKVKGYTYTVTGPDGVVYNTMADALAANPNFDETNNGSSDTDAEMQQFVVNYKADQQTATITQQYADGAENTPAFPQANQTLTNGTDQITTGTITAPKGYKIDTVPQVAGMVWNIATDGSSATYTITFDVVADNDGASQAAVVTYVPVEQKVRVDLYDEVGRPLTDSQGKQQYILTGQTNNKVDYTQIAPEVPGYTLTSNSRNTALTYDNDSNTTQVVKYIYADVTEPVVASDKVKNTMTASTTGAPATEADFLKAINYVANTRTESDTVTDNQQNVPGDGITISSDYETVLSRLKAIGGGTATVTVTAMDASGNTTDWTVKLTLIETSPVSKEANVANAQLALDKLASDPTAATDDVATARKNLEDAINEAKQDRATAEDAAKAAQDVANASVESANPQVAKAQKDLQDALDAAANDKGTTQAIENATNALNHAVARAEASSVDTAPVSQEPGVTEAQQKVNNLLDPNSTATTEEIKQATQALEDAVQTAKAERDVANTDANDVQDQVADTSSQAVKDAVQKLEDLQTQAAADGATTNQIKQATQDVVDAVKNAAQAALDASTTPVTNEPSVQDAKSALEDVLNDPNSTPKEIIDATNAYEKAVADAKLDREDANDLAQQELEEAATSDQATDSAVLEAQKKLADLLEKAANGDATALTQDIANATKELQDAVNAAGTAQTTARTEANATLGQTAPVSNETDVSDAVKNLQTVLGDPKSTADQITTATKLLQDAVDDANTQRNAANSNAVSAINAASASNQADEPEVQAAVQKLQDLIDQAASDSADALTQDIIDVTKALQDVVNVAATSQEDARQAAETALGDTAPVSNEVATSAAGTELNTVLNDPAATVTAIKEATQQLLNATAADKSNRSDANRQANTAIRDAQNSNQAGEPEVIIALQKLKDAQALAANDSSAALTQTILDDIQALKNAEQIAWQNQSSARSRAEEAMDNTPAVTNEATVQSALDNQNNVLNNPSSTVAEIDNATQALTDATNTAKADRDAANQKADTAISKAQNSNQGAEQTVQDAIRALQEVQEEAANDSADALTADIQQKIAELQTAVTAAAKTQEEARNSADDAKQQTAPVTNEPAVQTALDELNEVLNNPASTADAIKQATQQLLNATEDTLEDRDAAKLDAQNAITNALGSDQSAEPAIQAAIKNLQDVIKNANADSPDALTEDIKTAQKALEDAISGADAKQQEARDAAQDLIGKTAPVSNEVATAQARNALESVLANTLATANDIEEATQTLQEALAADNEKRDSATTTGNQLIETTNAGATSNEPLVQKALADLQNVVNEAAMDTPNALTKDIQAAIDALNAANDTAKVNQATAREAADSAISQTAPVSNESAVKDAQDKLQSLINDPTSTAKNIEGATKTLITATATAKSLRDDANDTAETTIDGVQNDDVANEPSVQAAIDRLRDVMNEAAANNENNLTVDIQRATDDLKNAITAANTSRQTAVDAAETLLQQTAPLSNESAVSQSADKLNDLLDALKDDVVSNDPTTAELEVATKGLQDALQAEGQKRTTANNAAETAIDQAKQSKVAGDSAVQDALNHLQDVMNNAANNDPDALTADIESATKAVQDAMNAAKSDRDAATTDANNLIGKVAPISNEPGVAEALQNLQDALNGTTTGSDIRDATTKLQQALDAANAARNTANDAGKRAITDANVSAVATDPAVVSAMRHLQDVMNNAANDNPEALTADIEVAIEALQYAITNAKNQGSGEHPTDNTPGETEPGTTLPDSVTTVPAPGQTPELVDVMPSVSDSDAPIQLIENSQPQIVASAFGPGSVQLPYTAADGQRQNWHMVSLGIYLFSTMFLLGATKRRKNEDKN